MRRCGVLGDPVAHSLSPTLHRAGYAELDLDWSYDAHRVVEGGLGEFVAGLDGSWRGLSLTMPLKREALAIADQVSQRAERAGAANTLVIESGALRADNTDIPGAVAAIRERHPTTINRAVILGGGATAASLLLSLAELGCAVVELRVRNPATAVATLEVASGVPLEVSVSDLDAPPAGGADLLASTIPASAQSAAVLALVETTTAVFDVIYDPWPTPLVAHATASGVVVIGGLDLLAHQAALQFEQFTGVPAPLDVMRNAGVAELAARLRIPPAQ